MTDQIGDRRQSARRPWSRPEPGIVVVDPGFLPTTRQMALAVAERVRAYYTPLAVAPDGLVTQLPVIGPEAARRTLPEALAAKAHRLETATELTRLALSRAGVQRANPALLWRRNIALDARVPALLKAGETVIGQYGGCLASFKRAKVLYGRTVLDYPIAREEFGRQILADEAAMRPEFADTLTHRGTLAQHAARMNAEIDLADIVVVGSQFAARSFEGVVEPSRLHVIPYGVDASRFSPAPVAPRRERLRVLFAGTVTQRKGIAYLLDAMRELDPARFELTIAGPTLGSGRGLSGYDGLYRHRVARPQDMPAVFRRADVLVLPSLLEGSALVVLEAMASGIPVIVTPNAGADALRDGVDGFVVPLRSADAIAARLEQLQQDDALRRRMGASARARSLEFTWDAFRARFRTSLGIEVEAAAAPDLEELSA